MSPRYEGKPTPVTRRPVPRLGSGRSGGGVEAEDLLRQRDVDGGEDGPGSGGGLAGLGEGAGGAGEDANVQILQVLANGGPGAAGAGLDDAHQQQGEPAEQDVGADAVFEPVVDRA